jgi:hypothetical protein
MTFAAQEYLDEKLSGYMANGEQGSMRVSQLGEAVYLLNKVIDGPLLLKPYFHVLASLGVCLLRCHTQIHILMDEDRTIDKDR